MSQQQIVAKCKEVFARAQELYGVDLSKVTISFNLKGRRAGVASWKINCLTCETSAHTLRFNHDMVTRNDPKVLRDMVENTVPHEIAHLVCAVRPELGKNHDYGWARVCRALGGSGGRTHSNEVVYGKGRTFEYTTDRGHQVRIGERHHAAVQAGRTLRFKAGKGNVTAVCKFSIVGYQGRTLQQPVVPKPVNHPANIEAAVRATTLAPVVAPVRPVQPRFDSGASKATVARAIMLSGYQAGKSAEEIIQAIMLANGHTRALASSYYKNNTERVGIPSNYS